jgi:hypothetical protein
MQPTPFTFTEQLILNATGPILAAVLGTAIVGTLASKLANRAQERRENHMMRDPLITEISTLVGRFYMELQSY